MTTKQGARGVDQGSTQGPKTPFTPPSWGSAEEVGGALAAGDGEMVDLQTLAADARERNIEETVDKRLGLYAEAHRRKLRRLAVFQAVLVVLVIVWVTVAVTRCDSAPACGCSDERGCSDAAGVDVEQLDQVVELDAADQDADDNACADDGAACADDNACTVRDECWGGRCVGSPVKCDDGDMCTRNVCDTLEGCLAIPLTNTWCDAGVPR